jgi:hypothetical protein
MKSVFQVFWPLSIILLLGLLVLRQGGAGGENPLSDHSVERWLSLSAR